VFGEQAKEKADKIFEKIDNDGSGLIEYSEWILATIDKEALLSQDNLEAAFKIIDADGGGTISSDEVKNVVCSG
jgi:calcium-dependent protein kinase